MMRAATQSCPDNVMRETPMKVPLASEFRGVQHIYAESNNECEAGHTL